MARASGDPRQTALDLAGPAPGSLNFDVELRAALTDAIAASGKSREAVAAEMERLLGTDPDYPVSRAMLDAWTAPSRTGWRFPALYLPAFILVTGAYWLLDRIAGKCGRIVISGEQAAHAELGRIRAEQERLRARERELTRGLRGRA